ncbi:hypothetical protein [Novosphingobium sp. ST904]|uniref:DUF3617 domain-containing protein n=2 Tax=Sphingomonadaceae TaxID=41297 RepID=UPI001FB51A04|nr:hypothetical protein [Novosphingobium sp. ST904]
MTTGKARGLAPTRARGRKFDWTKRRAATVALAAGALLLLGSGAQGQKRSLAMLDQLEPGSWELREHGESSVTRNLCIGNGRQLIQLRHQGIPCRAVVVEDTANEVVVQYTCRGQGYGRTRVRRETNGLIQIDSQGIVSGLPFVVTAEGRRTGSCRN